MLRRLILLAALAASPAHAGDTVTDSHGITHGLGLRGKGATNGVLYWTPTVRSAAMATYDLRTLGWVAPIKDQGQCGSCWAFSITKSLESALLRASRGVLDLSEQQLVSCDTHAYGCNGGMMDDMDYVVKTGLALESKLPYRGTDSRCPSPLPTPAAKGVRWGYVGGAGREPTLAEIKQALLDYGTLSVTVAAGGNDWSNGGHMRGCNNSGVNHMVNLVGWLDTDELIVANSWGTNWGDSGFAYAKQHCDELATGDGSVSFVVVDGGPAPTPPHVLLPAEIDIAPGAEVMIGVRPENGVAYSWTAGGVALPDTEPMLYVSPKVDTVYQLTGKTAAGTAQSSVKVHIIVTQESQL